MWPWGPCTRLANDYRLGRMLMLAPGVEPGLVTLAKIVGTLLVGIATIPILFLLSPGDQTEPEDRLDSEQKS